MTARKKVVKEFIRLFNEEENVVKVMVSLLSKGKPNITFNEILKEAAVICREKADRLAEDAVLAMEGWRMILPAKHEESRSLAWESQMIKLEKDEPYTIPACIIYAFKHLLLSGEWTWKPAVREYFIEIRDKHVEEAIRALEQIVKNSYSDRFVSASIIDEACKSENYPDSSAFIAKLKGGGIISPCLKNSLFAASLKLREVGKPPIYELNKALFVKVKSDA